MNHDNHVDVQCIWDLEFEGLIAKDGNVTLPISVNQWNSSAVNLDMKMKERMLQPILDKIWNSIQSNLNKRIEKCKWRTLDPSCT